ncbi:MAG: tetratricopeptide repeat protein, partial [Proteobacteria bacterium]|nr:tetratricopeptide repeat protein [Pseudomonadota bacterium]
PAIFENGPVETRASDQYYAILREQPGNSYLFDRFYNAWLESGTTEQLETRLEEALEQSNGRADRLLLAFFYEKQGQDREALRLYREGTKGQAPDAEYLYFKARAESRHLEFDAAISDLVQARTLECSPEVAEKTGKLLGELYIRTHQKDKAADLWAQLLATGTENLELYEDLIELQIKEGLFEDARKTSEDLIAITKDPQQVVIRRLRRGDIYQYKGDTEKALAAYAKALGAGGAPPEIHRSLGLIHLKSGQSEKAWAAFAKYLELKPDADDIEIIKSMMQPMG